MDEREEFGGKSRLDKFRAAVRQEFGRNLEKATPANVREFMDRYQEEIFEGSIRERFELNEPKTTYEEILKDFFARVLDRPSDEALIMLWTIAFEMSFAAIEQHLSLRLEPLFGDLNDSE
ncbi:MAG TPA: hypothetical protein VFB38_08030 [Chthonomonadaceae bacterium]|nr:hypothetical protein [Chthonomonadaceae bacterium]